MKYEQTDLWPAVLDVEFSIYVYYYLFFKKMYTTITSQKS